MFRQIFGLRAEPSRITRGILGAISFVLLIAVYWYAAHEAHISNPDDKVLPTFFQMADTFWQAATVPDARTGQYQLWTDIYVSLFRVSTGVVFAAVLGVLLGVNMALFPGLDALLGRLLTVASIVPPIALMTIFMVIFGVEEQAKIVLIFTGTVFFITGNIYLATKELPREQVTKALTLGASELGVVYRVILPQIIPRLIDTTRLSLGNAWIYLIASEALAATDGLGYRIFLVQRYLDMATIIPYVAVITLLGYSFDQVLRFITKKQFPWFNRS